VECQPTKDAISIVSPAPLILSTLPLLASRRRRVTQAGIQRILKGFNAKKRRRGRPRVAKTSARWWSGLYRPPWSKDAERLLEQCPVLLRAHCCCSHASYPHMTKILQQQPLYQPQALAQQYMPRQQVKQNLNPFPNALGPAAATLALQWSRALHPHLDGDSRLFFLFFCFLPWSSSAIQRRLYAASTP